MSTERVQNTDLPIYSTLVDPLCRKSQFKPIILRAARNQEHVFWIFEARKAHEAHFIDIHCFDSTDSV